MLKNFIANESGAVTVDWVVLTAALVGLGLAVMTVVSSGVAQLSTDIDEELSTMGTQSYTFLGFTGAPATPPASGTGG